MANMIDDEEFILLYDLNRSHNPDLPYWNYENFDLDNLSDEECKAEFRFFKNDIYNLQEVLNIPEEIVCYNGLKVDGIEALSMFLKRFAYPCRYMNMIPRFGRPVPQLSIICNKTMDIIYNKWSHLLTSFNQNWLSPANLQRYADAVHEAGGPLTTCWGKPILIKAC